MKIPFQDLFLEYPDDANGSLDVGFRMTTFNENKEEILLWECALMGLWRNDTERETPELLMVWGMHNIGDYFQQTLVRHDSTLHSHTSYTAVFHDIIRENRQDFDFIKNIYSTSNLNWLSMGFHYSIDAKRFWDMQVEKNVAEFIEAEERYRALL